MPKLQYRLFPLLLTRLPPVHVEPGTAEHDDEFINKVMDVFISRDSSTMSNDDLNRVYDALISGSDQLGKAVRTRMNLRSAKKSLIPPTLASQHAEERNQGSSESNVGSKVRSQKEDSFMIDLSAVLDDEQFAGPDVGSVRSEYSLVHPLDDGSVNQSDPDFTHTYQNLPSSPNRERRGEETVVSWDGAVIPAASEEPTEGTSNEQVRATGGRDYEVNADVGAFAPPLPSEPRLGHLLFDPKENVMRRLPLLTQTERALVQLHTILEETPGLRDYTEEKPYIWVVKDRESLWPQEWL